MTISLTILTSVYIQGHYYLPIRHKNVIRYIGLAIIILGCLFRLLSIL